VKVDRIVERAGGSQSAAQVSDSAAKAAPADGPADSETEAPAADASK